MSCGMSAGITVWACGSSGHVDSVPSTAILTEDSVELTAEDGQDLLAES